MKWMFLYMLFVRVSVMAEEVKFSENVKDLQRLKNAMETDLFQLNPGLYGFFRMA